jgi:hypothetical protein
MKRELKWSAMSSALALTLTVPAFGVVITSSQTAPSTNVIISQPSFSDTSDFTSSRNWGQSFITPSVVTLDKITMAVAQSSVHAAQEMTLTFGTVVDADGQNADADIITTISTTHDFFSVGGAPGTWYITFDIPDFTTVANGNYAFEVHLDSGGGIDGSDGARFLGGGGAYADGSFIKRELPSTYPDQGDNHDLLFFIQEAPAVPEPGSATLACMGLLGLVGFARRR